VELLCGLALTALIAAAADRFMCAALCATRAMKASGEVGEAAALAAELVAADIRGVGFGLTGGAGDGLRRAGSDSIALASDWNGDGDTADPNERIGYRFDPKRRRLLRQMGGAPPQPMVDDLAPGGFRLRYFTAAGRELSTRKRSVAKGARKRVARVEITVVVEADRPGATGNAPIRGVGTAVAHLRNARPGR